MTDITGSVCDCPEPCACYAEGDAQGKGKAHSRSELFWAPTMEQTKVANPV